ncbi:uncharacterized protein [Typha latifolia]|uniref:uncharacterized protein n=1 Tax=Typha latifolia TaxID=4733 RepID=UPI003C2E859A
MDDMQPLDFPSQNDGTDNDVLQYLEFSNFEFNQSLAPPDFSNIIQDPSFWDFDPINCANTQLVIADEGKCDVGVPVSNISEVPVNGPSYMPPDRLDCGRCHVLREVVHSNGLQNIKLSIHGGPGVFYHATLELYDSIDVFAVATHQSYIDLSTQDLEWVKQFLVDYGIMRVRDNYVIVQDSVSLFYDVLCTRMSCNDPANADTTIGSDLPEAGLCPSRHVHVEVDQSLHIRTTRGGIAAQRERTGKLRLSDLMGYFHLPIAVAAKELNICSTALKKICRRYGIARWPHRKIKSIDRRISSLQRDLHSEVGEGAAQIQAEIERLKVERSKTCAGLPPKSSERGFI